MKVRSKGIKMGMYYSGGFDWSFDFRLPEGRYHPTMPGFYL